MKKQLFILIACTLASQFLLAQTYPDINYARPRIYVDSSRFAYLHANMDSGDVGSTYNSFNNAVLGNWYNDPQLYMLGTDSSAWTW
ncbi:MAG: hypothetical protein ABIV51_06540, partial [Saprospiraceae bacterium]